MSSGYVNAVHWPRGQRAPVQSVCRITTRRTRPAAAPARAAHQKAQLPPCLACVPITAQAPYGTIVVCARPCTSIASAHEDHKPQDTR